MKTSEITSLRPKHEPHKRVSERYTLVSTPDILKHFERYGWTPVEAAETKTRLKQSKGFQRHVVRLRHKKLSHRWSKHLAVHHAEMILSNSHDGLSSVQIAGGWFVEPNHSLVVSRQLYPKQSLYHKGQVDIGATIKKATVAYGLALPTIAADIAAMEAQTVKINSAAFQRLVESLIAERWRYFPRNFQIQSYLHFVSSPDGELPVNLLQAMLYLHHNLTQGGVKVNTGPLNRNATTRQLRNLKEYLRFSEVLWTLVRNYHT